MEAVCTDLVTDRAVDGGHCASTGGSSSCQLTCPSAPSPPPDGSGGGSESQTGRDDAHSSSSSSGGGHGNGDGAGGEEDPSSSYDVMFCRGSGYDMHMEGFVSVLGTGEGGGGEVASSCLLLFFAGWKLDSRLKFAAACIFIFAFGVLVEYCTSVRRGLFKKVCNCAHGAATCSRLRPAPLRVARG